jgi:uncharacterized membrane protein YwzB
MRHNYLAILVCALLNFLFTNIWYGSLFGAKWYALHHLVSDSSGAFLKNGQTAKFNPIVAILSALIGALLSAFLLSYLFQRMSVQNWKDGVTTGAFIGLLAAIVMGVNNLFVCDSVYVSLIEGGGTILLFGLYGAVLGGWRKK